MANKCKYYKQKRQYKYVEESTWHDVTPAEYQKGSLYEYDSADCPGTFQGKWIATYTGGSVTSAECDSTSAITQNEITLANLESVVIGDCVTSIGDNAFLRCSGLTSATISDTVTSIGDWAFRYCSGLTSINIPSGVTSINEDVFNNCSSLINITIPDSVTSIGFNAFSYCYSLTGITIPSGVTSIDVGAFAGCSGFTNITILATTPPTLLGSALSNTNDCPIYVPSGSVNAYKTASVWSNYASRIQAIPT